MIYNCIFCFFIYAFLGWCAEVAFHTLTCGSFSNRGFLYGPICPIYGFGAVIVLLVTSPFAGNIFLLFLVSAILTTALELVTGFVLDKIFHNKWWDYSMYPFNLGGYICPLFSILWGLACVLIIKCVHPALMFPVKFIPKTLGTVLLCVFGACFIADSVLTVLTILKFNRHLRVLEKVACDLKSFSDSIGLKINDNMLDLMDKGLDAQIQLAEQREKFNNILSRYRDEIDRFKFSDRHLLSAFPDMKSRIHNLESIKNKFKKNHKQH